MSISRYNLPIRDIKLNAMQALAVKCNLKYKIPNISVEAARGTGKSTVLGYFGKEGVKQMPRATGIVVGESFIQIKSRTLPSTKEGLEMFGLYEDIDYTVGKCGKDLGFEMPFQAPSDWRNVIHFRNGHILALVSMDNPDSGRGLNAYYTIGDEAALLTYEKLYTSVTATNRAKKEEFSGKSMEYAQIYVSSVPLTKKGEWFIEREKLMIDEIRAGVPMHKRKYAHIRADAYVNAHNLKPTYIEDMRKEALSQTLFEAEILNIRPRGVLEGFYGQLKPKHYYSHKYDINLIGIDLNERFTPSCKYDKDLIRGIPLQMNLDFGGKINCMTISQYLKSINTVNFIKEFFRKHPDILDDVVQDFIDYYEPHKASCNEIHIYRDKSGNKKEANSKTTLAEDVINKLRSAGWKVIDKTPQSNNPGHLAKYKLINYILAEKDPRLPIVRINADNCPNLIISMENAPLKGDDAFEKDKSSERSKVTLQEHATHFSDTLDYNLFWQFWHLIDLRYQSSYPVTNLVLSR